MTTTPWPKAICFTLMSPVIILQSANQSLYCMFALLHGSSTVTRDKQCLCCMQSNHNLSVYTFSLNSYRILKFWILEVCYKYGGNL